METNRYNTDKASLNVQSRSLSFQKIVDNNRILPSYAQYYSSIDHTLFPELRKDYAAIMRGTYDKTNKLPVKIVQNLISKNIKELGILLHDNAENIILLSPSENDLLPQQERYASLVARLARLRSEELQGNIVNFTEESAKLYLESLPETREAVLQSTPHEGILGSIVDFVSQPSISNGIKTAANIFANFDSPLVQDATAFPPPNTDKPVKGVSMAAKFEDAVADDNFYGDQIDPMNIRERCKIAGRVVILPWTLEPMGGVLIPPTTSDGTIVPGVSVTPSNCGLIRGPGTSQLCDETLLSFLSKYYTYWRGSLKFTIEVVCSKYHQGQLLIAYAPGRHGLNDAPGITEALNLLNVTIDLGVNTRTEIIIPYIADTDYKPTGHAHMIENELYDVGPVVANRVSCTGMLYFYVQNPLDVISTVERHVEVNVYVEAGDDFEFKVPTIAPSYKTYDNGSWQSGEVIHQTQVPVPIDSANTTVGTSIAKEHLSNVSSVDTDSILSREYLVDFGKKWNVSENHRARLHDFSLPQKFFANTSSAPRGISDYHYLMHSDFEVTIKLNPTPFHQGALLLSWVPSPDLDLNQSSFSSMTQFPHKIVNIGMEKEATIHVPYSHIRRLTETTSSHYGRVYVHVWNKLRAGTDQSQFVSFSLWVKAVKPYMAVKKVKSQSGIAPISDTVTGEASVTQVLSDAVIKHEQGYIKTDHFDLKTLMVKPDIISHIDWEGYTGWSYGYVVIARMPFLEGCKHKALAKLATFWSGNNRISFTSGIDKTVDQQLLMRTNYIEHCKTFHVRPRLYVLTDTVTGSYFHSINTNGQLTVDIPYYGMVPFAPTHTEGTDQNTMVGTLELCVTNLDVKRTTGFLVHSAGESFKMHLRRNAPITRYQGLDTYNRKRVDYVWEARSQSGTYPRIKDPRDLLEDGDVEANPGPVFSKLYDINHSVNSFISPFSQDFHSARISTAQHTIVDAALQSGFSDLSSWAANVTSIISGLISTIKDLCKGAIVGMKGIAFLGSSLDTVKSACESIPTLLYFIKDFLLMLIPNIFTMLKGTKSLVLVAIAAIFNFLHDRCGLSLPTELKRGGWQAGVNDWAGTIGTGMTGVGIFMAYICKRIIVCLGFNVTRYRKFMRITCKDQDSFVEIIKSTLDYIFDGDDALDAYNAERYSALSKTLRLFRHKEKDGSFIGPLLATELKYLDDLSSALYDSIEMTVTGPMSSIIKEEIASVQKAITGLKRDYQRNVGRAEPLAFLFSGGAGQGKTILCNGLDAFFMTKDNGLRRGLYIMPHGENQKFVDGYKHEDFCMFDEWCQDTESKDMLDLINYVTPFSFPIQQAEISKKGDFFDSRMLFFTTNIKSFDNNSKKISDVSAVERRFFAKHTLTTRAAYSITGIPGGFFNAAKFSVDRLELTRTATTKQDFVDFYDKVWTLTDFGVLNHNVTSFSTLYHRTQEALSHKADTHDNLTRSADVLAHLQSGRLSLHQFMSKYSDELDEDDLYEETDSEASSFAGDLYYDASEVSPEVHLANMKNFNIQSRICIIGDTAHCGVCDTIMQNGFKYVGINLYPLLDTDVDRLVAEIRANNSNLDTDRSHFYINFRDYARKVGYGEISKTATKPFPGIIPIIVGLLAGAGGIVISIATIRFIFRAVRSLFSKCLSGMFQTGYDVSKYTKPDKQSTRILKGTLMSGTDDRYNSIRRNFRSVTFNDGSVRCVHGIALNDHTLLLPYHFVMQFEKAHAAGDLIETMMFAETTVNGRVITKPFSIGNCTRLRTSGGAGDACIVNLHTVQITGARDIVHLFIKDETYAKIKHAGFDITLLSDPNCPIESEDSTFILRDESCMATEDGYRTHVHWATPTNYVTRQGDCGRPYLLPVRYSEVVLGIHSYLHETDICGITIVTQEQIRDALEPRVQVIDAKVQMSTFEPNTVSNYWHSDMENFGTVTVNDVSMTKHIVPKTQLIPLKYNHKIFNHPKWGTEMRPAAQNPSNGKHPLYTNSQKYANTATMPIPELLHKIAIQYYIKTKFESMPGDARVLTDYEAINGYQSMNQLVLSTSPGYWNLLGFKDGKKQFFTVIPHEQGEPDQYQWSPKALTQIIPFCGKTFVGHYESCQKQLKEGVVPFMPWVSSTKDELRPNKKVDDVKTRVFEMPALEYTLLVRKHFGHFIDFYKQRSGFTFHHGIGRDRNATWAAYYNILTSNAPYGFDIDYSNYDGTVPEGAFDFFLQITDHYYKDLSKKDQLVRHGLIHTLKNSYLIVGKNLCHTTHGNKSGNPMTDMFNSISNTYLIYIGFMYTQHKECKTLDLSVLDDHVKFISYGDDIVLSAPRTILSYFNRITFADFAKHIGMKVTAVDKEAELIPYDKCSDLSFLNAKFRVERDVVFAPMPKRSIYKELQYQPKGMEGDRLDFKQRIDQTLGFMAHHGQESYDIFREELRERGTPLKYLTVEYKEQYDYIAQLQSEFSAYCE